MEKLYVQVNPILQTNLDFRQLQRQLLVWGQQHQQEIMVVEKPRATPDYDTSPYSFLILVPGQSLIISSIKEQDLTTVKLDLIQDIRSQNRRLQTYQLSSLIQIVPLPQLLKNLRQVLTGAQTELTAEQITHLQSQLLQVPDNGLNSFTLTLLTDDTQLPNLMILQAATWIAKLKQTYLQDSLRLGYVDGALLQYYPQSSDFLQQELRQNLQAKVTALFNRYQIPAQIRYNRHWQLCWEPATSDCDYLFVNQGQKLSEAQLLAFLPHVQQHLLLCPQDLNQTTLQEQELEQWLFSPRP